MAERGGSGKGFRVGLQVRFTGWMLLITAVIMVAVMVLVRREMNDTLEQQIKARGLALARNLATSCVEPMQLSAERMLSLMLLAKEYVQTGGGEETRRRLFEQQGLWPMAWDYVKRFGREVDLEGVRNQGVLSVTVVDAAGMVAAYADAVKVQEEWFEPVDKPYQPSLDTGRLAPGQEFQIWNSRDRNGIYLIAVPITEQAVAAAAGEPPARAEEGAEPAAPVVPEDGAAAAPAKVGSPETPAAPAKVGSPETPAAPASYGAAYLAMSQALVRRAVARAVAYLILVAVGITILSVLVAMVFSAALTRPIRLLQSGVQAIAAGDFGKRLTIKRSDEIGELTDAFNDMAKGLAERETMRGAFSAFVSPELLKEIIRNPDALKVGGVRRVGTSMFCYFANHHEMGALAERIDPEALVRNINDYLGVEARIVFEHGGYLDKFIGDVVLAVWGALIESSDHAARAVACAHDIQKAVAAFNAKRSRDAQMTTSISIGINTGPLVAGNMGSEGSKLDYTVIGEDVNFAARLAGAGATLHGGTTWIGRNTFQLVKDLIDYKDLGEIEFKGLGTRPVIEVVGMKEAAGARR